MTNTRVKITALIGLAFCILTPIAVAQLEDAPWPRFHHDPNHTGLSTHNGPDTAIAKWAFPTGDRIYGSSSIGEDGTAYIGTNLKSYAIHPNGTKRWHWTPPSWRWGFGDGNYGTGDLKDPIYHNRRWNGTGYDPFVAILTVTDGGDPHQLDDNASIKVIVYMAGDGIVNILDATIVGLEWSEETVCGAYCWEGNEQADRADLNNDYKVNILDAVIIGTCWGDVAY